MVKHEETGGKRGREIMQGNRGKWWNRGNRGKRDNLKEEMGGIGGQEAD
jgi:hypothetical protein